jgi:pimeloyl-[acyl-carrier protein] methyl ester esterase
MAGAVWGGQLTAISENNRFMAIDLRGHGNSGMPEDGLKGFEGFAADIISVVEQNSLHDLVLVGWSLGAQAVLKALPAIHEQVSSLVLVGATPRFTSSEQFPYGLKPIEAEGMRVKIRRNFERTLNGFQTGMFSEPEQNNKAAMAHSLQLLSTVKLPAPEVALDGLEALMNEDLSVGVSQVTCPTLILHGGNDRICLPGASIWLEKQISGSKRICYPDAGHAPFLSNRDRFNADLLNFIGGVGGY